MYLSIRRLEQVAVGGLTGLRVHETCLTLVTSQCNSVVMDQRGKRFCKDDDVGNGWGAQGWFPATYAVPVQELAMWRGNLLRLEEPSSDGTIVVHDMSAGSHFFSGPPNSFSVHWY